LVQNSFVDANGLQTNDFASWGTNKRLEKWFYWCPSTKHMIFLEDDMVRSRGTLHGYDSSTTRAPFAYGQGALVWLFQWQPPNPANRLVIRVEPLNDTYFPLQKADSRESALFL